MKNILLYSIILILTISCAQIVAPTGGKQDIKPPVLIESYPKNQSKNFNQTTLKLQFDELIDASSINSDLVILPTPPSNYTYKIKNNTLTLHFDKPFAQNTTYNLNFRNGIKDLTEKNPTKNLKLVFSTGNTIDSLKINGKLQDLFTKQPTINTTIGLFLIDTLPLNQKKPYYFTTTDSLGNYSIENIQSNTYFLMAFNDINNNLRYDQKTEKLAFLSDSLHVKKDTTLPILELYMANYTPNKIKRTQSKETEFTIQLDKTPKDIKIQYENIIDTNAITYTLKQNVLNFYRTSLIDTDTIKTTLFVKDSLNFIDTLNHKIYFREITKQKNKKEAFNITSNYKNNQEITTDISYDLYFDQPIKSFDKEKIIFKTDTIQKETPQLIQVHPTQFKYLIKTIAKRQTELIIPSNTFMSYTGDTNSLFKLNNIILHQDQLGTIEGKTNINNSKKIAFLQKSNNNEIVQTKYFIDTFKFINIVPGEYKITIIIDSNDNKSWDAGNIKNLLPPENVIISTEIIRVRANHDLTLEFK